MEKNLKAKYASTILAPRVTEKATALTSKNVYAFEISETATKHDVANAVKAYFDVTPKRVTIVRNPAKKVFIRGKWGTKKGIKKAYVYLKEGDKIE